MTDAPPPGTWRERLVGERSIWLCDDLVESGLVRIVEHFIAKLPHFRSDYDTEDSKSNLHFKHEFDLDALDEHVVIRAVRDRVVAAVERIYGASDPVLKRVHTNDSVFGEVATAHYDLSPGVTALYFVNAEWRDGWDGETLFYADGEAVAAVAPVPGRVVLFPGDLLHRSGVPARLCTVARRTLAFKFVCATEASQSGSS